jgi:fibronectin type 3 domain-containing protein/TolB-like protein
MVLPGNYRKQLVRFCMVLVVACLAVAGLSAQPGEAAEQRFRSRLGCVPFVATNMEAMAVTDFLTTMLLNELERSGGFEVTERKRLESVMDLEGIRSDALGREQLQRLGGRLGVDYLVSGTVMTQASGTTLDLQVLGMRGQQVVLTEKLRMHEAEAPKVLQGLAQRIRAAAEKSAAPVAVVATTPLQPVQGVLAAGSTNAIRLSWTYPEPGRVIGYMVMRSPSEQGPFNTVATVTEPAYSDEQLRLNETYYYRVVAVGHGGSASEPTKPVRGATSIAPAVPIFMNVEPILGGAVLSWRQRPFSGGDERMMPRGVRIYRRTAAEKEFVPVGTSADEPAVFRDQGLANGVTYLYLITALNQAGAESERSVQLSVTTPAATAGLTAASGKVRRIPLSWQVHPFAGVTGYRIQRAPAKEGPYQELAAINDRTQTTYTDTNLTDKANYWYRIVAFSKEQGTGGPSPEVMATTRDLPPTPVKLTAGQGEPRRVTLTWESTAVPDDEITVFHLYRGEAGQDKLVRIAEVAADKRSYRDDAEPLKDAASYAYVIAAVNAGGAVSPLSSRVMAVTKAAPTAPQGLQASRGEPRRVTVRWSKNPEQDIAEYHLFRKQGDGGFKLLKQTADTQLVDSDLKDGTTYQYQVQAVDRDRLVGALSGVAEGSTKPLPAPVTGVQVKDRAARLIGWQAANQPDIKRYHVYKKSFLGSQKLATVETTEWKVTEPGKLELFLTVEDADGLESEPSALLAIE